MPENHDERKTQQSQVLLHEDRFMLSASTVVTEEEPTLEKIRAESKTDPIVQEILKDIQSGSRRSRRLNLSECEENDGILLYQGLVYVPNNHELKMEILKRNHDAPAVGHPGRARTYEIISRNYFWPESRKFIQQYVSNCDAGNRAKPVRHAPYGTLKPLEIPAKPWDDISMDMIVDLPRSNGFDSILVVVDRLSKMAHYIPCQKSETAESIAKLFTHHIFRLHGLPKSIISDRGPTFTSEFWRQLLNRLKIDRRLSTAFHPESDGQTERVNAILE